ncbi:hypothetical protein [Burkholderia glumae]|uniref:hypothetical protein n=1 Tax=Burkholderia glumae TaxID=337 RepID=UPI002150F3CA|nr:hypothetical protein [Burkholderia glumae]
MKKLVVLLALASVAVGANAGSENNGGMTREEAKAALAFVPCRRDIETGKVVSCPDTSKAHAMSKADEDKALRAMVPEKRKLPW